MAEIVRKPLVSCDVCGAQEEKKQTSGGWQNPPKWGFAKVQATVWGTGYPNPVNFPDLCPDCNAKIHDAVMKTVDRIHEAKRERR